MDGKAKIALIVLLGVLTLIGLLLFVGYKIYQDRQRLRKPVIQKFLCAAVLIIIWALSVNVQPLTLPLRILAACSAQYGVLLYYCGLDQMLNNKRHRPVIRSRVFAATTLIVIILIVLDLQLGNDMCVFGNPCSSPPTQTAYIEHALSYFGLLYLDTLIIWLYAKDLRRHSEVIYTSRRILSMLGFLVNMLGCCCLKVV